MARQVHRVGLAVASLLALLEGSHAWAGPVNDKGPVSVDSVAGAKFKFDGVLGERVKANMDNWLLVTPDKNPGLLEMFVDREANVERDLSLPASWQDPQNLVPWAGEYVGKYLISAVQAMRMSDEPRLRETVGKVVDRLLQLQAEDGYLGPWPKKEQLLGHWDLWGNYHVMLGLILWHERTGDEKALVAARRAADLVCDTFLDTKRRVLDAGECDKNMAIVHGLAILYRTTGEPRYLRMAQEVLQDFEKAGDYYREGLKGTEFFRTPKPRWESLHCLQGLAEWYRITGDETFQRSFLHHWASIRRFELRNTGGFSSSEQAAGNPFPDTATETCCVIAWEAVMIDALRLSGSAAIADDLELATFNAVAGAQHPSGQWSTYNTPMNGTRQAFHVEIPWQGRPNAPFLGCCPVNAPRGFGMLSEWAVMRNADGLAVNYFGPMRAEVNLADGTPVVIEEHTDYPVGATVRLTIRPPTGKQFTLALRIPAWSMSTDVVVNGQPAAKAIPGEYLKLNRTWQAGDEVTLRLDFGLRYASGDLEQAGRVSLYRGPILLCADERFQTVETTKVDVAHLGDVPLTPIDTAVADAAGPYRPWLVLDLPASDGQSLRLIDFASAGATGRGYRSWLPAVGMRPPVPVAWQPSDGAKVGPGAVQFRWREQAIGDQIERRYTVMISDSPGFERTLLQHDTRSGGVTTVPAEDIRKLPPNTTFFWKIVASNQFGQAESIRPYKQFTIDPTAAPSAILSPRSDGMLTSAPLRGDVKPEYGLLIEARGWKPAQGPAGQPGQAIELDGKGGRLKYELLTFPGREYTVAIWVSVTELPTTLHGQVFSAWCGADEPLRIVVTKGQMFARLFLPGSGNWATTEGVPVEPDRWRHVAAVKANEKLLLYVDGQLHSSTIVPAIVFSNAKDFAIGGNPNYQGEPEFLAARLADLRFYDRALLAEELKVIYEASRPK